MDIDDAQQPDLDTPARLASGDPELPCAARWRRRGVEEDEPTHAHIELPLDAPAEDGPSSSIKPERAPRDIELWQLARRAQGAVVQLDFELRTALARQLFRRDFVFVSRQLHALEASRRVQGLDRARLNDALADLLRRADEVQALLQRIGTELQGAIDTRAPANARIAFARPARFQAIIVSPIARRHLALLVQADHTLARLEMARLLGLVEPMHRSALASDCRRALHGFKELVCGRRQAIGEAVRVLNAERREGTLASEHR